MNETWKKPYFDMIIDILEVEDSLTDWERQFIDSIQNRLEKSDKSLTIQQVETLESIHNKVTQ